MRRLPWEGSDRRPTADRRAELWLIRPTHQFTRTIGPMTKSPGYSASKNLKFYVVYYLLNQDMYLAFWECKASYVPGTPLFWCSGNTTFLVFREHHLSGVPGTPLFWRSGSITFLAFREPEIWWSGNFKDTGPITGAYTEKVKQKDPGRGGMKLKPAACMVGDCGVERPRRCRTAYDSPVTCLGRLLDAY